MSKSVEKWIPLVNYSMKYGVSLSTLRRRIKSSTLKYKLDNGKYLVADVAVSPDPEIRTNETVSAQPAPVSVPAKNLEAGAGEVNIPAPAPGHYGESILTTANRIIEELKGAYSKVLAEQEEQIGLLKDEIADLRTLTRVLEDQLLSMNRTAPPTQTRVAPPAPLPVVSTAETEDWVTQARPNLDLDPMKMHDAMMSGAAPTGSAPLSDRWTEALQTHRISKGPARQPAAESASKAPVVGSPQEEEFFFDDAPVSRQKTLATSDLPEIDLANIKIPENFELDFDF